MVDGFINFYENCDRELEKNQGMIFDIKKYAIHDGPGIRTTIFFKGCPLRCPWCQNPEGIKMEKEIIVWQDRCIKCEDCLKACDRGAISLNNRNLFIDAEKCDLCGECIKVCHPQTIEIVGREITVGEVMREIEKDLVFYDESRGGVTFSGGEPLMQPRFLEELLKECKGRYIHTTLDTSGYAKLELVLRISELVDLFLYDLKHMDSDKHRKHTGVPNEPILNNLKELSRRGKKINVRIPVIPGVNEDNKNMEAISRFLSSLPNIDKVCLLPHHNAWVDKFKRLRRKCKPFITEPPSKETMGEIKNMLEGFGLKINIGG